jgi:DNA ligase-associated metallophosphoesterase
MQIRIRETDFTLLSEKALWRPDTGQLIIADIHLGKASHFRKAGISIPADSVLEDMRRLDHLMKAQQPKEVILLGDLFHSSYNREWHLFEAFLESFPDVQFILIKGNHDILKKHRYELPNFSVIDTWEDELFLYSHEPMDHGHKFVLSGHVHPGITLSGKGKQYMSLPCFHISENQAVLPAFGKLTGLYILDQNKDDRYYLVYNDVIREMK